MLSVREAAAALGVTPARVRARIKEGTLTAKTQGGLLFVYRDRLFNTPQKRGRPWPKK